MADNDPVADVSTVQAMLAELKQGFSSMTSALKQGFNDIKGSATGGGASGGAAGAAGDAGSQAFKEGASEAIERLKKEYNELTGQSSTQMADDFSTKLATAFTNLGFEVDFSQFKAEAQEATTEALSGIVGDIDGLLGFTGAKLGEALGRFALTEMPVFKQLHVAETELRKMTGPLSVVAKQFQEIGSEISISEEVNQMVGDAAKAAGQTGMSFDRITDSMTSLTTQGLTLKQLRSIEFDTGDMEQNLSQTSQLMLALEGSGLAASNQTGFLTDSMRKLGRGADDTAETLVFLKNIQSGVSISINEVQTQVFSAADTLRFYGDNIEGAGAIYKNFLETLGEGKVDLAAPLFQSIVGGIEKMNLGMRAFIGMSGDLGGGAGAIGSGLRVEEALAGGDISGVLSDLEGTVRQMTGADIMSRKEAIDSGQEQQFLMQRSILGGALGETDTGKTSMIMEMMSKGLSISAEQLQGGAEAQQELMSAGQKNVDQQTGMIQQSLNRLDSVVKSASTNLNKALTDGSESLRSTFADLADGAAKLAKDPSLVTDEANDATTTNLIKAADLQDTPAGMAAAKKSGDQFRDSLAEKPPFQAKFDATGYGINEGAGINALLPGGGLGLTGTEAGPGKRLLNETDKNFGAAYSSFGGKPSFDFAGTVAGDANEVPDGNADVLGAGMDQNKVDADAAAAAGAADGQQSGAPKLAAVGELEVDLTITTSVDGSVIVTADALPPMLVKYRDAQDTQFPTAIA